MTVTEVSARLLLSVAVIIATARLVGWVLARFRQPRVIGEIIAGVLLGPSLLGAVWPEAFEYLFPPDVTDALRAVAQLGLVLFMFLVGAEVELHLLRSQGMRVVGISAASIALPLGLGIAIAPLLKPDLGAQRGFAAFALFLGVAMAVTAFPVLARILRESGLSTQRIGAVALACAAVDDVVAWFLLATVVSIASASGAVDVLETMGLTVLFGLVMLVVVRPLLARLPRMPLSLGVAIALFAAWTTEMIGIHAIFGAFLAGVVLPVTGTSREVVVDRLEASITIVLLPVFFVVVGLSTRIDRLGSWELWGYLILILVVAVVGKLGGAALAARLAGEPWRDALTIGVLMNTRGLTEIVVITVGLELAVISQELYSMLVIMALVTTLMAMPLLTALGQVSGQPRRGRRASTPKAAPGVP